MKVNIKCFGKLAENHDCDHSKTTLLELNEGSNVAEALDALGIEGDQTKIVFVNHRVKDASTSLRDGDRVSLFPATGGM